MNNQITGVFANDIFSDRKNYGFIKLPNPRSGTDGVYLWNEERKTLQEIQMFNRSHKTWIVNNNTSPDPGFYVSNVVDPLFLAIPILQQHTHRFVELDTLCHHDEYPQLGPIFHCLFESNTRLELLADHKLVSLGNGDAPVAVYKFNADKALLWLAAKVDRVATVLARCRHTPDDDSPDLLDNGPDALATAARSSALDIVSDYVSPQLEERLREHLGLTQQPLLGNPQTAISVPEHNNYENEPPVRTSQPKSAKKGRSKASIEAIATGNQSIRQFFSPQAK